MNNFGVTPDILLLGKGLGGGVMPIAAMVAREGLDVAGDRAIGHYTHEKNPVACAAAIATLDVIARERLVQRARELGQHAMDRLRELMTRHSSIGDVRGVGLLLGVELVQDRHTRERACDLAEKVLYGCLAKGLSFKLTMGNILLLTPPLTITQDELDRAIDIIDLCLGESSVA